MNSNTTEQFLHLVRQAIVEHASRRGTITTEQAQRIMHAKLLYGVGDGTYRGICIYRAWENGVGDVDVIEIAAVAQESWVQLAGTLLHEIGHVLAGGTHGHDNDWKDTTVALGFRKRPDAAGQRYTLALFDRSLRFAVHALAAMIADGSPAFRRLMGLGVGASLPTIRPCSAGIGTRGGTSRGKGSGSRLRLWECSCERPVKVRIASDDFRAHCDVCGSAFTRK